MAFFDDNEVIEFEEWPRGEAHMSGQLNDPSASDPVYGRSCMPLTLPNPCEGLDKDFSR